MIFAGLAYAAEAFAQDTGGAGGLAGMFNLGNPMFLMIAMLAIFYFLLIRPQQKRQKEHKQMLANLQKGDTIFTCRRTPWKDNRSRRERDNHGNCRQSARKSQPERGRRTGLEGRSGP